MRRRVGGGELLRQRRGRRDLCDTALAAPKREREERTEEGEGRLFRGVEWCERWLDSEERDAF